MARALENKRSERTELRRADGRDYEILAAPLTNPDGTVDKAIEIVQDITERKQSEEALRESEENLAKAQEIAHVGSWEWDLTSNEVKWSDELFRILGFEPDEVKPSFDLWSAMIHPSDVEKSKEFAENARQGEEDVSAEYRIVRKDKSIRHIFAKGHSQFDNENNPVRMHGIVQDITERKQAEETLRESEEKYRMLFNTVSNAIMLFDAETKEFVDVNDTCLNLYGYSK
jgi:PAS domain S-box-containing protein